MRLIAALVFACLAAPASAQILGCPEGYVNDALLKDAMRFQGWTLDAWGLNDAGHMEELWRLPSGEWTLVLTTAMHCSTVLSRPSQPMGRLSVPSNDADVFGQGAMTPGERM